MYINYTPSLLFLNVCTTALANFELLEIFRERERERAGVALCWGHRRQAAWLAEHGGDESDSTVQTFGSWVKGFPRFDLIFFF